MDVPVRLVTAIEDPVFLRQLEEALSRYMSLKINDKITKNEAADSLAAGAPALLIADRPAAGAAGPSGAPAGRPAGATLPPGTLLLERTGDEARYRLGHLLDQVARRLRSRPGEEMLSFGPYDLA